MRQEMLKALEQMTKAVEAQAEAQRLVQRALDIDPTPFPGTTISNRDLTMQRESLNQDHRDEPPTP